MVWVFATVYGLFGAIVGSFLNVVVLRYHTGRSLSGRSACLSCNQLLSWIELVPIVSFVLLRGRCRACGSAVSVQYPIVELATALLFSSVAVLVPEPLTAAGVFGAAFWFAVFGIMVLVGVYDIRHTIIPDVPTALLTMLSIAGLFFVGGSFALPSLSAAAAGPIAAAPLAALWFVSRGRWMGLGDAKLALGLGWLLGLSGAVSMLVFSFWIGALVSVPLMIVSARMHGTRLFGGQLRLTMKSEVPFGPFLIAAFLAVLLFGFDIAALVY